MKTKKYIVQFMFPASRRWVQSGNAGADGKYTKESAQRRARYQEKHGMVKYRIKETK
jgi:hypothetical protein